MNFSKTTSYSLKVLAFMAEHQHEVMSANYLNSELHIPYAYLRRVLGELSRAGIIKSNIGRSGGFVFRKDISRIHLADIVNVTEGMESFNKCIMSFESCPFDSRCPMHDLWEKARNEIISVMESTSLADLVNNKSK